MLNALDCFNVFVDLLPFTWTQEMHSSIRCVWQRLILYSKNACAGSLLCAGVCVCGFETNNFRCCFSGSWFFFLFTLSCISWLFVGYLVKMFCSNVNGDKFMCIELWLCHHLSVCALGYVVYFVETDRGETWKKIYELERDRDRQR